MTGRMLEAIGRAVQNLGSSAFFVDHYEGVSRMQLKYMADRIRDICRRLELKKMTVEPDYIWKFIRIKSGYTVSGGIK